jgi:GWxTD domain-containing protein
MSRIPLLAALLISLAASVLAADDPLAFAKGPAKWLMTQEEERTWRTIKTTDEAQNFVDLFWARRDPTPGTYDNEYRSEFLARVDYADKKFKELKLRGSMSERGRVLVTLGFPSNLNEQSAKYQAQESGGQDITGGQRMAGREVWIWNHADALKKFEMPKVEVVFLVDPAMHTTRRDPARADFLSALPAAIRKSLVSPDLKEVPVWGRLQMVTTASNVVLQVVTEGGEPTQTVVTTTSVVPAELPTAKPKSAGKLTLVRDAFALDAQTKKDPFSGLESVETFKNGSELGFVAEYCAGVILEELTGVTVQAKVTGMINGEKINMNGSEDELVPDSIRVSPGCHLVRGAIPLEGVDAGQYTLTLTIASASDRYNLTREFRVE